MPSKANHERGVVAEIGWPEVLGVDEHSQDVGFDGLVCLLGVVGPSFITAVGGEEAFPTNVAKLLLVLLNCPKRGKGTVVCLFSLVMRLLLLSLGTDE